MEGLRKDSIPMSMHIGFLPGILISRPVDNGGLRLVDSDKREEMVLQRKQVEQQSIATPAQETHKCTRNRVQNKVVGCGDDGDQDQKWIREARETADQTAPRELQPENPCPPARATVKDATVP